MSKNNPPKILFPCDDYPIRIIGEATDAMLEFALETTAIHAPGFDRQKISIKTSRKGRFQSVTLYITATGEQQLTDYHQALISHGLIKMVM